MKRLLLFLAAILPFLAAAQPQDYFQQRVNTQINVTLDDEAHELNGDISIEYINNSTDQLDYIWMHLWPNAYSGPNTALAKQQFRTGNMLLFYAMDKQKGGIDSLDFTVNGADIQWEYHPEHADIAKLYLKEPLQPGGSIVIRTPFRVDLPSGSISRLGHVGQSYQITQWYPKPAVYDKDGWHEMPYLNMGEFYSEYGSFDVSVTLPKNYVIGATGDLTGCPEEEQFLNDLAEKTAANLDSLGGDMEFPPSSSEMKTVRYLQDDVHDFAWFADKRWHVLKGEVELPHSKRKVTTWAMFTPRNAEYWKRGIEYINDGTYYYSLWNGDYPYNHVTAVDGTISAGGGMEYPNITVIGNVSSALSLETVIVHEVGHNWFYGILGSNERTNAWMDEGINSFNETRYLITKYDSLKFGEDMLPDNILNLLGIEDVGYRDMDEVAYLISARLHKDQPMQCHSDEYRDINYGVVVYKKTAAAFEYLQAYLGEERFDKAMMAYFETWKFKHPQPEDLRAVLEKETGEDLSWFFEDLVKTTDRVDYTFRSARTDGGKTNVTVENRGGVPGPVSITAYKNGNPVATKWAPGAGQFESTGVAFEGEDYDAFRIDKEHTMLEYDRKNNYMRAKGLFKKVEPLELKFLTGFEDPDRTQLFYTPVVGWNNEDRWMLGLNLHNTTILPRDWEFSITPMYSIARNQLNGFARTSFYRGPMQVHLSTRRFSYVENAFSESDYWRNELEVNYEFNQSPTSPWSSSLWFDMVTLRYDWEANPNFFVGYGDGFADNLPATAQSQLFIPGVGYTANRNGVFVDHTIDARVRYTVANTGDEAQFASVSYSGNWRYNREGKQLRWRLFGGFSDGPTTNALTTGENGNLDISLPLTGVGLNPGTDIYADHLLLSRSFEGVNTGVGDNNPTLLQRQITDTQGSIRIPFIAGRGLISGLAEWELPFGLPLTLWAGAAFYETPQIIYFGSEWELAYSAGVSVELIENVAAIHVPLYTERLYTGNPNDFTIDELITFEFHIDRMNPWKLLRNLDL
jgi:hypothetical protein